MNDTVDDVFQTKSTTSGSKTGAERIIRANDDAFNSQFNYANNFIKTSKYTLLTFLPFNLLEQFQRLANFYFLCLMLLQMISVISSLTPITTSIPLIGVLTLTAIKDAYDDYQRHENDNQVNRRISKAVRNGRVCEVYWSEVHVGDVIFMQDGQFIAADVLLLSTSEPNGLCFIETAELDGETNLKCKQCLPDISKLKEDAATFDGEIRCELPNNLLNRFNGTLRWRGKLYVLDNNEILLRGCVLRNTEWCYGVVIFAGQDTKLMQNSGKAKFKRTTVDKILNSIIVRIVSILVMLCAGCGLLCRIWEMKTGRYFQLWLPWDSIIPEEDEEWGASLIAVLVCFSYAIVLNTLVPISLYVSVEVIRFIQSFYINWDKKMYCSERNMYAKARTTTLNEDLGQIQYIFSDKTGTLTRNVMAFKKCSIHGHIYGDVGDYTADDDPISWRKKLFSWNSYYKEEELFDWTDGKLVEAITIKRDQYVCQFFTLLAICHTVMPNVKCLPDLLYQAQSPDEAALVAAARNFGFVFKNRSSDSLTVNIMGVDEVFEVLCILDFNNYRKRMSVIVKDSSQIITLYCKGADNVIFERLGKGEQHVKFKTTQHLNAFAGDGLRTLCLASRTLDEEFFESWKKQHQQIATTLLHREEQLNVIYDQLETDMCLLGVTAIEDKLQEDVPQTVATLLKAGINVWMLTGDKQETAVNVGYSCELLAEDNELLIIDGESQNEVSLQISKWKDLVCLGVRRSTPCHTTVIIQNLEEDRSNGYEEVIEMEEPNVTSEENSIQKDENVVFALVVNGHSLVHALHQQLQQEFTQLCALCKSVICCRATPLQKALIVEMIQKRLKCVTLAIGDGANDVSMIKAANIGIGISGMEGNQATLASDFCMSQFRFLGRLLLVHGRWSYYRMCKFLRYFFYKNVVFTMCHIWYAYYCGYSAHTIFDPMFISVYNLFYTSLPVMAIGVLDQDVDEKRCLRYPFLYAENLSPQNRKFDLPSFFISACFGCVASAVLFANIYGNHHTGITMDGRVLSDYLIFSDVMATILVIVVSVQAMLDTAYWTIANHIAIYSSLLTYIMVTSLYNTYSSKLSLSPAPSHSLFDILVEPSFWLVTILTVAMLAVPVLCVRLYTATTRPSLTHHIRKLLMSHSRSDDDNSFIKLIRRATNRNKARRPSKRRSIRSGYAFAHQEGFGRLITSGKLTKEVPRSNDSSNDAADSQHVSSVDS